ILASDPNSLGVGQLDEDTLRELKFYFDYRRAVNTLYERNRRNKDYSYYEYVRDSKMSPAKLGMTR
uniref:hypothetical protein n=1 Tax=Vibrio vulnificus TaxID=672 RepID=UPI0039B48136